MLSSNRIVIVSVCCSWLQEIPNYITSASIIAPLLTWKLLGYSRLREGGMIYKANMNLSYKGFPIDSNLWKMKLDTFIWTAYVLKKDKCTRNLSCLIFPVQFSGVPELHFIYCYNNRPFFLWLVQEVNKSMIYKRSALPNMSEESA